MKSVPAIRGSVLKEKKVRRRVLEVLELITVLPKESRVGKGKNKVKVKGSKTTNEKRCVTVTEGGSKGKDRGGVAKGQHAKKAMSDRSSANGVVKEAGRGKKKIRSKGGKQTQVRRELTMVAPPARALPVSCVSRSSPPQHTFCLVRVFPRLLA